MRVTNKIMAKNFLNNLYRNMDKMDNLQNQLSSSKKFSVPSEDPIGVVKSMGLTTSLTELEQYKRNISKGISHLEASDTSVSQVTDLLKRARELTIEGANGTMSQTERDAIAGEFDQILESLFNISNSSLEGKALFGGYKTLDTPFKMIKESPKDLYDENGERLPGYLDGRITQIVYDGDDGNIVKQVEKGINLKVNTSGNELFLNVKNETIISGRDNIASPNAILNPSYSDQKFSIWVDGKQTLIDLSNGKGDTLNGIADAINNKKAGVTAVVVQDDTGASALKITADKPGYENSFVLSSLYVDPTTGVLHDYKEEAATAGVPYILDDYNPDPTSDGGGLGLAQRFDSDLTSISKVDTNDTRDIKDIPLTQLVFNDPVNGAQIGESAIKSGNIVINGFNINIEKGTDTLNSIAEKINNADIDVHASFDKDNKLVLESVGELEILDDKSNFLSIAGLVDDTGRRYNDQGQKEKAAGIFDILLETRNKLLKGDTEGLSKESLKDIDDAITHTLNIRTKIGARLNRFEQIDSRWDDININLKELLSDNEDIDVAKTITDLQLVENTHQATLKVGGKIIPPSLMDFL